MDGSGLFVLPKKKCIPLLIGFSLVAATGSLFGYRLGKKVKF